jgi:hypothetical protein
VGGRSVVVAALVALVLLASSLGLSVGPGAASADSHPIQTPSIATATIPRPASGSGGGGPLGISDTGGPGEAPFATAAFLGAVRISSLSTYNASLGSAASEASFQLNAFVTFALNGTTYDYWVQDVVEVDTSTHAVYFEDNLWNASSPSNSTLARGTITGSGTITNSSSGAYYGYVAAATFPGARSALTYPATVDLGLNATLNPQLRPTVSFAYDDGLGWVTYDTVTFHYAPGVTDFPGFSVNGAALGAGCPRCWNNVELVLGGPYGGFQTTVAAPTQVEVALNAWTGSDFAAVPDADNLGSATAEGAFGASVTMTRTAGGSPAAKIVAGTFTPAALWRAAQLAELVISVGTSYPSGTAQVNGTSTPFVRGSVLLRLVPGNYTVRIVVTAGTYSLGPMALVAGSITTQEVGALPVVFFPQGLPNLTAWAVTLGNQTLRGTGAITFGVGNGTLPFTVAGLAGYTADPASGNISINGSGYYQTIGWTQRPSSLWSDIVSLLELRIGPVPLFVLIGGLAVLGIVAAVLGGRSRRPPRRPYSPQPQGTHLDEWS